MQLLSSILHPYRRSSLALLFAALGAQASSHAHAQARCRNVSGNAPVNISFPTEVSVARDIPTGQLISEWVTSTTTLYQCNNVPPGKWVGAGAGSTLANMGVTVNVDGKNFAVYKTDVDGVGMIARVYRSGGSLRLSPQMMQFKSMNSSSNSSWSSGPLDVFLSVALVKIGYISGGLINAGRFGTAGSGQDDLSQAQVPINYSSVRVIMGTCTTPDVTVRLDGKVRDFTGINTGPGAKDFQLGLSNCSTAIKTISVRLDPTTTVIDASRGIVALDRRSQASGVGIQIQNNDGTPVKFGESVKMQRYVANSGGNQAYPLKAGLVQTGNKVTAGPLSSSVVVTMTYL